MVLDLNFQNLRGLAIYKAGKAQKLVDILVQIKQKFFYTKRLTWFHPKSRKLHLEFYKKESKFNINILKWIRNY